MDFCSNCYSLKPQWCNDSIYRGGGFILTVPCTCEYYLLIVLNATLYVRVLSFNNSIVRNSNCEGAAMQWQRFLFPFCRPRATQYCTATPSQLLLRNTTIKVRTKYCQNEFRNLHSISRNLHSICFYTQSAPPPQFP